MPLPLSGRAQSLYDQLPFTGDDRALLTALIDDEGAQVRRVLTHVGIDVGALHHAANTTRPSPTAPPAQAYLNEPPTERLRAGAATAPEPGWLYVTHTQDVPVSPDRVWAMISNPNRRADWGIDCSAAAVLDNGSVELTRRNGTTVTQVVTRIDPGQSIAWQQIANDGQTVRSLALTVEGSGNYSTLHVQLGWPHRTRGRLARRITTWAATGQLRIQAQSIAQTSSA